MIRRLQKLAGLAMSSPPGMGIPVLTENSESWAPYYRFLFLCVQAYCPQVVLELGTYLATAAEHMALARPETLVVAVDIAPQPRAYKVAERYSNLQLIVGDSCQMRFRVESIVEEHGPIGLLFLDSIHDGDTPRREFETYRDLLADETIVACDDLLGPEHLKVKMQVFWEWLPCEKVALHELHPYPNNTYPHPGFGVGIWRRK